MTKIQKIWEMIKRIFSIRKTNKNESMVVDTEKEIETHIVTCEDVEKLLKNMKSISRKKTTMRNASIIGKELILTAPDTYKIGYIVLSGEEVKKPICGNNIRLEIGDIVLVMTYKLKHNGLCVARYQITDIKAENNAVYFTDDKVNTFEEIDALDLPRDAIREIYDYFLLVRR